ncbi:MAG TPA: hypothetical protein VGR78_17780, partial [Verrucomicrobiae bacterium]|nr:hypothetical protein [Verrucomicrobiae bacterium]
EDRERGIIFQDQKAEAKAEDAARKRKRTIIERHANASGIDPETIRNPETYREGCDLEEEADNEMRALKQREG